MDPCSSNLHFSRVNCIYVYMYVCLSLYIYILLLLFIAKSCPTLCNPVNCSMLGFPVLHYLPAFAQIRVCWVTDAIQPSHVLSPSSPPVLKLSQHQGLVQWAGSSHQVAQVHSSSIGAMYIYLCSFEDLELKTSQTALCRELREALLTKWRHGPSPLSSFHRHGPRTKELALVILTCFFLSLVELAGRNQALSEFPIWGTGCFGIPTNRLELYLGFLVNATQLGGF